MFILCPNFLQASVSIINCNLGQNICTLLYFLAQLFFITTETELDYYHQKVRKLGYFWKIAGMLGLDGNFPAAHPKAKF